MVFANIALSAIAESDLQACVTNQVAEGQSVDYKLTLPGNRDSEKKEFLADVISFANASGGHLIFGMDEQGGVPTSLDGIPGIDPDAEIRRLTSMVESGIEPRIPGLSMRAIPIWNGNKAIVIAIPRSWALPHRVSFQDWGRFYSRNSAGKYPLNVAELRALFNLSDTVAERIRQFRAERLANIVAGEVPAQLDGTAAAVLHVVPFGAFDMTMRLNTTVLSSNLAGSGLQPLSGGGYNYRHNFDGLLTFNSGRTPRTVGSYLQIFRNGILEAVDSSLFTSPSGRSSIIPSATLETSILDVLPGYLAFLFRQGIVPPLCVLLSLLSIKNYALAVGERHFSFHQFPIDRDALLLPEILVEQYDCNVATLLKPAFDTLWNAAGWPGWMNY